MGGGKGLDSVNFLYSWSSTDSNLTSLFFSFISLKKGNRKQNKDVKDKQCEKRHCGKIIFKTIM